MRAEVAARDLGQCGAPVDRLEPRHPAPRARVGDLASTVRAEAQRTAVGREVHGQTPPRPQPVEHGQHHVARPRPRAADHLLVQLVDGQLGVGERGRDRLDHGVGLLRGHPQRGRQARPLQRRGGQRAAPQRQLRAGNRCTVPRGPYVLTRVRSVHSAALTSARVTPATRRPIASSARTSPGRAPRTTEVSSGDGSMSACRASRRAHTCAQVIRRTGRSA